MSTTTNHQGRRGDRLQDGRAHTQDHSRRSFLRNLGLVGAGALMLKNLPVNAVGMSPLGAALSQADSDRVLVLVRLKGGNDGLNTFIPVHDYGTYRAVRPNIYIPESQTVKFSGGPAGHPALRPLERLWNEGAMRVVRSVGYPDQNLSHFRSSDIWASTSDSREYVGSGVFGRYIDRQYPDFLSDLPDTPPAIQIGGQGNLLFSNEDGFNYALSTANPTKLYEIASTGQLYDVRDVPECAYGEQLGYVRAVANTTFRYAGVLAEAFDAGTNGVEYPNDLLSDQLSLIARMLRGGLRTRLFVVELDGFDTHASQSDAHRDLLSAVAGSLRAFYDDLGAAGQAERVLSMTFSEFGRRIEQNGSQGTDHGAAAPLMLFGPALEGNGTVGTRPDLENVDEYGNLKHDTDFRSVYATVLSGWLCIDNDLVDELMGGAFERIDGLGLNCAGSPVSNRDAPGETVRLRAYLSGSELIVDYQLQREARVSLRLLDMSGRVIATPVSGRRAAGEQRERISMDGISLATGLYVARLEAGGRGYSTRVLYGRR